MEGKCALVSRRLSGHPRMIELAVGVASHGWEELEKSLKTLSGDLEEQLRRLLETGLKLVAPEGQVLLGFLPFFGSGKFMREEMEAVAGAAGRQSSAGREEPEPTAVESADDQHKQTVDRGLGQLERAGLIEFDQGRWLYTFHQTLLDHVVRQPAMDPDRARSVRLALLAFHADYVRDHNGDDEAINRCVENILSTLEIAWGLREEESSLDLTICFVVNRLGYYFERRGLWRVGKHWLERAIALRRASTLARDQAALSQELYKLGACPNICSCSRMAAGFRWALAFSASAQPCGATIPLNLPRRCRSGTRSSKDCGSSISVATRPTLSPGLATETCGFLART